MKKSKIISLFIILMPLLDCYGIFGIDFSLIACGITLIILLKNEHLKLYKSPLQGILLYILIFTPICWAVSYIMHLPNFPSATTVLLRYGKMILFLLLFFNFGARKYFDLKFGIKSMNVAVLINVVFICIQYICFKTNKFVVTNPLLYLSPEHFGYGTDLGANMGLFRPSAFFLEPSHLAQYFFVFLGFVLFNKNVSTKVQIINAFLCTLGIVVSRSGMGMVGCALLLLLYIFLKIKNNIVVGSTLLCLVIVTGIILLNTEFVQIGLKRITDGSALSARVGNGYEMFFKLSPTFIIFGCGFGNVPINIYLNGLEHSLISLGIVGSSIFIIVLFKTFKNSCLWKKVVVLIIAGLLLIADVFNSALLVFYFTILYSDNFFKLSPC